jgi:hypothetical protein
MLAETVAMVSSAKQHPVQGSTPDSEALHYITLHYITCSTHTRGGIHSGANGRLTGGICQMQRCSVPPAGHPLWLIQRSTAKCTLHHASAAHLLVCRVCIPAALYGPLIRPVEGLEVAQQPRAGQVKHSMELGQVVLDGCACKQPLTQHPLFESPATYQDGCN